MMSWLRRFGRAREGAAAVEFALVAPMMIVVLFASVEVINMLQCNRRVENTAISLADVISRDTSVTNAEMTGLWTAIAPLMFPDNATGMDLRVTSISIAANGTASVVWSDVCGMRNNGACGASSYTRLSPGTPVAASDLPSSNTPGSSLIRVETTYDYNPLIGLFWLDNRGGLHNDAGITVLEHTAFRRSRLVDPIPRVTS